MEAHIAELCALDHDYEVALAEYNAFADFCDTFEGDDIPDNLYEVACEIYGGDLARSAGSAIVKLAKKVWEIIVKILKWIQDFIVRRMKNLKFSSKNLERLYKVIANDRDLYDNNLKTLTKFVPDKQSFQEAQMQLAILYNNNAKLVDQLTVRYDASGNLVTTSDDLNEALLKFDCSLQSNTSNNGAIELFVYDYVSKNKVSFSKDTFSKTFLERIALGRSNDNWNSFDFESAVKGIIASNKAAINVPEKSMLAAARFQANKWLEEAKEEADNGKALRMTQSAQGLVKNVMNIIILEETVSHICSTIVERMGAYAVSGTLSLEDADLKNKAKNANLNPAANPLLGLKFLSLI